MSNITLTIPNDDTVALHQFGKALIEIASAKEGHPVVIGTDVEERIRAATEKLQQSATNMMDEPEVDTTAQQVESLAPRDGRSIEVTREMVELCVPVKPNIDPPTTDSTGTPWDERIHSTSKALNADGTWRLRRKPKDMDEAEWAAFVETVVGDLHTQTPVMTDEEVKTLEPVEIGEPTREEVDELIEASNKMLEPPVTHQNPVYMYQESRNVYALGRSEEEIAEYEAKGYVRHTQEQYDAWEGPMVADEGDDFHTDADVVTEQTVAGIPPLPVPPPVVVAPPVTEWDFPRLMTFLTERHGKIDVATVNTLLAQDGMSSVRELNAHPDKIGPFVARVKAHLGE
ncbi:hypothetical protein KLPPOU148_018 [Klebsiella phage vB_KpnM_15-38_KLPPOU148]|uniref:Uncharacterized protein n=1 Tax=Klebsiella phage vB_KpnM_15-38_KLPPOU148 TaxID=2686208 RepID=A0A6B9JBD7_9CAUD|nr:hypothetical protein PQZ55_gp18 [Klebsiella phage vB_KpnM_15-38_KLPPOU148]QGZ13379.1 hypothetical protein KLPPOU148_018 [Klebsiella phage vB_KpnM_15-38_KLPPOU148]